MIWSPSMVIGEYLRAKLRNLLTDNCPWLNSAAGQIIGAVESSRYKDSLLSFKDTNNMVAMAVTLVDHVLFRPMLQVGCLLVSNASTFSETSSPLWNKSHWAAFKLVVATFNRRKSLASMTWL